MSDARKTAANLQFSGHRSYTRKNTDAAKEGEMHDFTSRTLKGLKHLESEKYMMCFIAF